MKKLALMIALAAISFGSVYAHSATPVKAGTMQMDTTKKMKKKPMKMKKKKMSKDTTKM